LSASTSRPKLVLARTWALLWNALNGIAEHRGTQFAAAMSYYALFSVFPAAIVLAAVVGFVLDDPGARQDVIDFLFRNLPLADDEQGRKDIESLVKGVTHNSGTLGVIGIVGLMISASALISSARNAIDAIFGESLYRGYLRGKALDLAFVLSLGLLFALSFAATLLARFHPDLGGGVLNVLEEVFTFGNVIVPAAIGALVFSVLYTVLPVEHRKLRDVWPGVVFATIAYELVKLGFSVYLDHFGRFNAIYGSLGAVVAFMFFTYLAAIVFLIGAEMASIWPEVRAGKHDPGAGDGDGESKSFAQELRDFGRTLVSRNPTDEHEIPRE
jgi:membrane protein